jgi:hypothetical protein
MVTPRDIAKTASDAGVTTEVLAQSTMREANGRGYCLLIEITTQGNFPESKRAVVEMLRVGRAIVG